MPADRQGAATLGISEGILLAAVSVGAYWIAFRFECAYLGAFGFTSDFSRTSFQSALVAFFALSGGLLTLYYLTGIVRLKPSTHPAIRLKVARISILIGIAIWQFISYGPRSDDVPLYIILSGLVLIEAIWPIVIFRMHGKTFTERVIADEAAESATHDASIQARIIAVLGRRGYLLAYATAVGGMLAGTAGDGLAKRQREFLVYSDDPQIAIIRTYDDVALCVHIAPRTRVVDQLLVRPLAGKTTALTPVEVGPLVAYSKWRRR